MAGCGKKEEPEVVTLDLSYTHGPTAQVIPKEETPEKMLDLDHGGTYYRDQQIGNFVMDIYIPDNYEDIIIDNYYLCPILFAFHGYSSSESELGETKFAFTYNLTNDVYAPNCIIAILHKPRGKWEDAYTPWQIRGFIVDVINRYAPFDSEKYPGYERPIWYYGFSQGAYDADYVLSGYPDFWAVALGDGDAWQAISNVPYVYYLEAYEDFIDEPEYRAHFTPDPGEICVKRNVGDLTVVDLKSRSWGNGPMTSKGIHRIANYWMCCEDSEHWSMSDEGDPGEITADDEFHGCLTFFFETLELRPRG